MAESDVSIYTNVKTLLLNGGIDLDTDVLKCILVNGHTLNLANTVLTDVSANEYTTALGYTVGGATITGQSAASGALDIADIVWTSLGPLSPTTPSHAIIYDDTHASDVLICAVELGTTPTNGQDYTLQIHATGLLAFS